MKMNKRIIKIKINRNKVRIKKKNTILKLKILKWKLRITNNKIKHQVFLNQMKKEKMIVLKKHRRKKEVPLIKIKLNNNLIKRNKIKII